MAGQPHDDDSREDRVDEVVALYLEAVERGEAPDALAYVGQHPDVASELLQFFADRAEFQQMADGQSPLETASAKPQSGPNEPTLGYDQDAAEPARPMRYVGDYELLEEIARGGMGVVYKARQMTLKRVVALKMILAGQLASANDVKRFRVEAEAAAQLDHPGIVPIYDVGEHEGQHYFSMGYVEGQSLATRLAEGPLPPCEAAELMREVAEAVDYAHRNGVIHRDLKPGNILLQTGGGVRGGVVSGRHSSTTHDSPLSTYQPKVTDFGLAKRVEGDSSLTGSGQILGTPSYMPPEQAAGKLDQVGAASDVYSLGAVLYCLLTGRPPFQSASVIDTLLQVLEQEPLPPRQLNPTVPRDLETICLKCLRKEPDRRYTSAFELAADLRRQLAGEPIHARRTGVAERAMKRIKRRPAVALLVLTLVGSSLFGTLFALERQDAERAAGLVNELLHANIDDVPGILERMQDHWSRVEPILKAKDREDLDDAGARLRVALALLSVDESKVVYLKDQLLAATKEEFPVVRDMLTPRATEASLIGPLWAAAEDEKRAAQERFQAACALAALAPTDERWHEISDFVAGHLVTLEPSELAAWRTALRPAAKQLLEPLGAVYRNTTAGELPRTFAAATLADYAADDSDTLFDLLADAEPFQFVRIFNMLKAKPEQAADRCARELAKRPAADAGEDEKESLGKRQANAAVALLKLGEAAKVWPLLGHGPDPRAASYFVHWLGPLQAVPRLLHERLFETVAAPHDATPLAPATPFEKTLFDPDTSLRRTLLLALGEFDEAQLPQRERTRLAEKLWELYRLDPDSGVHSSVDWLLRKWQANDEVRDQIKARLRRVDGELAGSSGGALAGRRWHVNSQGQTMVVVPGPVRSLMGAPADERGRYDDEAQQAVSLDYTFAIASRETTVEQITRWKKDLSYDDKVAPNGDCPINQISWYEAAEYCNWLSDQEGLPKDQWCYVNSDGATVKAKERFWELSGYRLPTEAEWECACRAGTLTSRFYGASESLLGRYAWYTKNSGDIRMLEVGTLKPNALGLFDTLGNACEWCGSAYSDDDRRVLRGGAFDRSASNARSAYRGWDVPSLQNSRTGFRVVRTLNDEEYAPGGTLIIIGGSLRPDNAEIFRHLIECAGGHEYARIVIFRCASRSDREAQRMRELFIRYGVADDRVEIVDLTPENAEKAASAEIVHQIKSANAAFFVGGDQSRITRSLLKVGGAPTPALDELKALWRRGGVIAGSSAGAAMQSNLMLSVSGLPDSAMDEGLDALDFGARRNPLQRGVLVAQGLGFFPWGIVDQHFGQSRGRLGRLARALLHEHVRLGFGVDENTAMSVSSSGRIKVLGTGNVTIVDTLDASCDDGPLGCRISGLRLSFLERGDAFDAAHGNATIRPEKTLIEEGSQDLNDNHLIGDIAAPEAVRWALIHGLCDNSCRKQAGVTLHYQGTFGHGYRFTFEETERTKAFGGQVDHAYSHALTEVQLGIEPIVATLQDPRELLPVDLPDGDARDALAGLWFRGILLADDQRQLRPAEAMTRAELAGALAQAVHLAPNGADLVIADVPESAPWAKDIQRVVAAGLMQLDAGACFRPNDDVTQLEAAEALVGLAVQSGVESCLARSVAVEESPDAPEAKHEMVRAAIEMGLLKLHNDRVDPAARFTRQEAAEAICRASGFSW